MAKVAALPSPPPDVVLALDACPDGVRQMLMKVRALILETASEFPEVGTLTETLKWGQPSYLTAKTKSGTTVRLGWDEAGTLLSLFVHCQTTLIGEWRARYEDTLSFVGNRELQIPIDKPFPRAALKHCIAMALTYHSRKTKT